MNNEQFDEDFQAWELFKDNTEYRWLFNKMEVALRQGLQAGPAGTAPSYSGTYVSRPTYNLYGMGIGAEKFEYNESMYELMIKNGVVPPGHFWCQWLEGDHHSIDYEKVEESWKVRSVWKGTHESKSNLTRFNNWTRVESWGMFDPYHLNSYCIKLPFLREPMITKFNLEMIGHKIIEIHLRWGNDPFDDLGIGTKVIPIWHDQEIPEGEWRGNLHEDMEQYSASGHLSDVRKGYIIERANLRSSNG